MQRIPNIELNTEQIKELTTQYKLASGGEGIICEGITSNTVAKLFTKHGKIIPMGDNKEHKIIELYKRQLEHTTIPVRTISYKGNIVGYEMTTNPFYDTYKDYQLSYEEQKHILLKTKDILEYFYSKGIIYGDFELRNILFDRETGDIIFCDMDNTQVDDYPIDKRPGNLEYFYLCRTIDGTVHPYMHNILTLRLNELGPFSSKREINSVFKKPAHKIAHSMRQPVEFIPEYVIDYIKK